MSEIPVGKQSSEVLFWDEHLTPTILLINDIWYGECFFEHSRVMKAGLMDAQAGCQMITMKRNIDSTIALGHVKM